MKIQIQTGDIDELIPAVDVPEGTRDHWSVKRVTITEAEAQRANINCHGRPVRAGTITTLMRGGTVVMSDTHCEKRDHFAPVLNAKGIILINGLGLGMVLNACLLKPEVTRAYVVESSPQVISLVGTHYREKFGDRLTIHCADAMTYKPDHNVTFGMVWHDIWDNICGDNLEQMKTLHRRYGNKAYWQGSWCRSECERSLR